MRTTLPILEAAAGSVIVEAAVPLKITTSTVSATVKDAAVVTTRLPFLNLPALIRLTTFVVGFTTKIESVVAPL